MIVTEQARSDAAQQLAGELNMRFHICLDKAGAAAPALVDQILARLGITAEPPPQGP